MPSSLSHFPDLAGPLSCLACRRMVFNNRRFNISVVMSAPNPQYRILLFSVNGSIFLDHWIFQITNTVTRPSLQVTNWLHNGHANVLLRELAGTTRGSTSMAQTTPNQCYDPSNSARRDRLVSRFCVGVGGHTVFVFLFSIIVSSHD